MSSCCPRYSNVPLLPLVLQVQGLTVVTLLFAAVAGDVTALQRHYLQVLHTSTRSRARSGYRPLPL